MSQLFVPSSIGEALDRLTILELKLEFIQDNRRDDVQREYNDLYELVKEFIKKDSFHYEKLLEVNRIMWQIQDILHEGKTQNKEQEYLLMKQLAVENQRRFRLKRTMNQNLGSKHREQKGYKGKRAFLLSHLGMGDHLFMNGAVRYLASYYDEVCVVVKKQYHQNLITLFQDEPSVTFHIVENDKDISPAFGCPFEQFKQIVDSYNFVGLCGYHKNTDVNDFPNSFYEDLGITKDILFSWSHLPSLCKNIPQEPYTFVHTQSSNQKIKIPLNTEKLSLNPSENMYPLGHPFYTIAQEWIGKPFFEYTELIKNAEQLYMIDSSFFCMALLLKKKPEVWPRNHRTYTNLITDLVEHKV